VVRDATLLREIGQHNKVFVNLTITTVNTDLARILEPRAPRPDLRLEAVRQLNLAGVSAGIICAPVLPGITDAPRDLEALVAAAAQAGAKSIHANALFLKPCSASIFLPFLEKEFPHLVASYRERFAQRAFLPPAYGKRLSQLMARLRVKHGVRNAYERYAWGVQPSASVEGEQLGLFSTDPA
jgi:DNA repair photolyase